MPTAIAIDLVALSDGILPGDNAQHIFYSFCGRHNNCHSNSSEAVTISHVAGKKNIHEEVLVIPGKNYRFYANFLEDRLFSRFYEEIYVKAINKSVEIICGNEFRINKINLIRSESYKDLARSLKISEFIISFLSPSLLVMNGLGYLFPVPRCLLKGYQEKWNKFCDQGMSLDNDLIEDISEAICVTKHKLETACISISQKELTGFIGKCQYKLTRELPDASIMKLGYLLRFSSYCGTGAFTSFGMGQTKTTWK